MRYRMVICGLLALVPLIAGCGLFSDGQGLSSTPGTALTEPMSVVPTNEPELTTPGTAPTEPVSVVPTNEPELTTPGTAPTEPVSVAPTNEPELTEQSAVLSVQESTPISTPPAQTTASYDSASLSNGYPEYGISTLEERILRSDVIVRARLRSKAVSSRSSYHRPFKTDVYLSYVDFTFDVLEVLRGSAGTTVVVELEAVGRFGPHFDEEFGYSRTAAIAEQRATDWLNNDYDAQWESRDAILFLQEIANTPDSVRTEKKGRPSSVLYAFTGNRWDKFPANHMNGDDEVTISSDESKVWLPATSTSSGATTFYLDEPHDTEEDSDDESSVTLTTLKSTIQKETATINTSIPGHRECLVRKKFEERAADYGRIRSARPVEISSGLPAGTLINDRNVGAASRFWKYLLFGDDASLFQTEATDRGTSPINGFYRATKTARPLPRGEYVIEEAKQLYSMVPCGYVPPDRLNWTVRVTAPEGTLHELLFDPQTSGDAAVADSSNGVLNPRNFTGAYGQAATIQRIEWQAGTVKVEVTPDNALAGQTMDIIELDGTVSLSLEVFDATVDAANDTLTWSVSEQPWEDGDKLMVRIREAPLGPAKDTDQLRGVDVKQIVVPAMMSEDTTEYGPIGIEERILRSDLIVRARFQSKAVSHRWRYLKPYDTNLYSPYVEFTFTVLEAIHGSASGTVVVELEASKPFDRSTREGLIVTSDEAERRAREWLNDDYNAEWEGRDAILFLIDVANSDAYGDSGRSSSVQYAFAGGRYGREASVFEGIDDFSIASAKNKVWLPATTTTAGAQTFYLESPNSNTDPATASLASFKSSVTSVTSRVDSSVSGYKECLVAKEHYEREVRPEGYLNVNEVALASGLSAGTVVVDRSDASSQTYWYYHLFGDDASRFVTDVVDNDSDSLNGYDTSMKTARPLPAGQYVIEEARQLGTIVPCGFIPDERTKWTFNVTAPEGTLHELFFDPETFGSAAVADETDGVLEPRNFTGAYGQAATIQRTEWQAGTVKLKVSPHTAIAGHILDFIELDGTVSLSLDVADAEVDAANNTLSWSVSEQPWEDGDKLMVRIREGR